MASLIEDKNKVVNEFLGRSGLKVSNISLGCMTFGESAWGVPGQCDEDLSHQILDRYVQWGGNFLDTADLYGLGKSEEIVGRWLERQQRDTFVVATKCGMNMGVSQNVNNVGLNRRHITASIDGSLQRLHTDFVDLYQTHIWDNGTPLEETLRTFDDLVRIGKVRYVGVSNVVGWQLQKLVDTSRRLGLNPIISLQQQYNLLSRWSELESFQVCKAEGVGVLPWSPLKGGMLTGKIKRGVPPTGRTGYFAEKVPFMCDLSDGTFDIVDAVGEIAKKIGFGVTTSNCPSLNGYIKKSKANSRINKDQELTARHTPVATDINKDQDLTARHTPVATDINKDQDLTARHTPVATDINKNQDLTARHTPVATDINKDQDLTARHTPVATDINNKNNQTQNFTMRYPVYLKVARHKSSLMMQKLDDVSEPTLPYPYQVFFRGNKDRHNPRMGDNYVRSTF